MRMTLCDRIQQEYKRREVAMENVYSNYEILVQNHRDLLVDMAIAASVAAWEQAY